MAKRKKNRSKSQLNSVRNFIALPHTVIDHPDYLSLNWSSQCLLTHVLRLYNGFNNGDISMTEDSMKEKGWTRGTLDRAKKDLLKNGWLIKTRQGGKNKCSLYAISWLPLDDVKVRLDISGYMIRSLK